MGTPSVGIVIPTMDRPDFIIRLLNYYAGLASPHPLYIGDASQLANAARVQAVIGELGGRLTVHYYQHPPGEGVKSIIQLLTAVKEPYTAFIGDDDYYVPAALTAAADWLAVHPDYATAMGRSVTIRVQPDGAYGRLSAVHDYPRWDLAAERAVDRLTAYLTKHYNSLIAGVARTHQLLEYFQASHAAPDLVMKGEVLPCALLVVAGKCKVLDRLGLVRQIHASNLPVADIFDQITSPHWPASYQLARQLLVPALLEQDRLTTAQAELVVKQTFWANLQDQLATFYPQFLQLHSAPAAPRRPGWRQRLAIHLPWLKRGYRWVRPWFTDRPQLHYEVTRPGSRYYADFQAIVRSVAG